MFDRSIKKYINLNIKIQYGRVNVTQKNKHLNMLTPKGHTTSLLPLLPDVIIESKLRFARMEAILQPSQFSGMCPLEPYHFFARRGNTRCLCQGSPVGRIYQGDYPSNQCQLARYASCASCLFSFPKLKMNLRGGCGCCCHCLLSVEGLFRFCFLME